MCIVSGLLLSAVRTELLHTNTPVRATDAGFAKQLSTSAAVQHLLLLSAAFTCHLVHKQQQGLSHLTAHDVAVAVSGSRQLAAAAAAAEAVAQDGSSSSSSSCNHQEHLRVAPHHTAVLELLLAPAEDLNLQLSVTFTSDELLMAVNTVA
jgi:hypothetical protein